MSGFQTFLQHMKWSNGVTRNGVTGQLMSDGVAINGVKVVSASRNLTADDNGWVLECTATATLTLPAGLPEGFACAVIPSGTTSVASAGGTLLNGATTTLTRAAASNATFAIQGRKSAANSYVVTGT